ncbi:MAG: DUF5676 family membrane protein [Gammaproteobacteria bacterium]
MNISPKKFALASAAAISTTWILCSLLVQLFPEMMLNLTSHMLHIDMRKIGWQMSPISALIGWIAWTLMAGFIGWLLAIAYKMLNSPPS